jgi:predicted AlkP superfamily phosphohydrolase/phosphomutase
MGLSKRAHGSARVPQLARRARDLALRLLPPALAQQIFRRARSAAAQLESSVRFGGFDWKQTLAFSEEANTQPGVWINLRGREAAGCVPPEDYEAVRSEVIDALLEWKLPDGAPVVARARRREEVYEGPFVARAPDIVIELALDKGCGISLVPTPWSSPDRSAIRRLADDELAGGRGRGMNGTHRPNGILIAHGFEELQEPAAGFSLVDVAPNVLRAIGVGAECQQRPGGALGSGEHEYTPEEEEIVAARLRAMGYLE